MLLTTSLDSVVMMRLAMVSTGWKSISSLTPATAEPMRRYGRNVIGGGWTKEMGKGGARDKKHMHIDAQSN